MNRFTIGEAWSQGLAFLNANFQTILILVGGSVLISAILQYGVLGFDEAAFQQQMQAAMRNGSLPAFFSSAGPAVAISGIVGGLLQSTAQFATFRVGLDNGQESVGSALGYGVIASIAYLLFSILIGIVLGIIVIIPFMLVGAGAFAAGSTPGAGAVGLIFLFVLALIPLALWLAARLSVVVPAMAEVRSFNPLYGFAQSWRLTRGNALPIIGFLIVLGIAIIVISLLLGGIFGFIGAAIGGVAGPMLAAVLVGIPTAVLGIGITAGIYRALVPFDAGSVFA